MAETPAATTKADSTSPAEPDDIPAGQALPGIRLIAYRVPECGIAGSYLHMDRADVHVTYAQVVGRSGQFSAQGVAYGLRAVRGRDVNSWLRGSLNFWLSSDARVTDDGVIRYRQTRNHSVVTFVPDKASGILINRPDEQVTAAAYRVTGPTGVTQLWRGQAVRDAIGTCRRKPPVGWPEGWAHLLPDASVTFQPGGGPMGLAGCLHSRSGRRARLMGPAVRPVRLPGIRTRPSAPVGPFPDRWHGLFLLDLQRAGGVEPAAGSRKTRRQR